MIGHDSVMAQSWLSHGSVMAQSWLSQLRQDKTRQEETRTEETRTEEDTLSSETDEDRELKPMAILNLYNSICTSLPRATKMTAIQKTRQHQSTWEHAFSRGNWRRIQATTIVRDCLRLSRLQNLRSNWMILHHQCAKDLHHERHEHATRNAHRMLPAMLTACYPQCSLHATSMLKDTQHKKTPPHRFHRLNVCLPYYQNQSCWRRRKHGYRANLITTLMPGYTLMQKIG